ncbi:MAG: hypothetical protein A2648_02965 [Candidatus Lloydbacteria bacterium RIFCSPHIGHO2_01_FULL_41_20]|uniref:Uncharacterized protein n=1 Tax=Candidatus Lloydbacteria bacterium RIFCSPHIGHO2_01_FULL_41_20 TaxID=1798657 RepID=A0A1G2CRU4_9BACT|nr:MAG: hypothetical protein A2648_02965 [Candidatus Lloydbacteria bacterium RIFCSPHIGHO2_01_FULL_41_20]
MADKTDKGSSGTDKQQARVVTKKWGWRVFFVGLILALFIGPLINASHLYLSLKKKVEENKRAEDIALVKAISKEKGQTPAVAVGTAFEKPVKLTKVAYVLVENKKRDGYLMFIDFGRPVMVKLDDGKPFLYNPSSGKKLNVSFDKVEFRLPDDSPEEEVVRKVVYNPV